MNTLDYIFTIPVVDEYEEIPRRNPKRTLEIAFNDKSSTPKTQMVTRTTTSLKRNHSSESVIAFKSDKPVDSNDVRENAIDGSSEIIYNHT